MAAMVETMATKRIESTKENILGSGVKMQKNNPMQNGFVLIASLLILIVMTVLAVSMFHSVGLQEQMAGNLREKARAFQVAQSTLQYLEYLLASGASSLAQSTSCSAPLSTPTICNNAVSIQNPSSTNSLMTISNGGTYSTMQPALPIATSGGAGNYYANPQFYVQYLGLTADLQGQVYELTALGYGGNPNTVAVVQSTYKLTTGTKNLGGL
jgi:type IV pilus assembly protein PilX